MHLIKFVTNCMVAALFALCAFTPQSVAVPTTLAIQNAALVQHNITNTWVYESFAMYIVLIVPSGLWYNPASDHSQSTFIISSLSTTNSTHSCKAAMYTTLGIPLPSWDRIVAEISGNLSQVTDDALNRTARERDILDKVEELRSTFLDIVATAAEFREHMAELTQRGMTLEDISNKLGAAFDKVLAHMKRTFPPPDQAPSHEERAAMVATMLEQVEQALRRFATQHGMSQEATDKMLATFEQLRPKVTLLAVVVGAHLAVLALCMT